MGWDKNGARFLRVISLPRLREVNLKCCTVTQFTVNPDMTTALPHNSVDGRKTQSRPLADFLRGKEWLKDAGLRFRIHAYSGVGNCQVYVRSGQLRRVSTRIVLIQLNVRSL